MKATFTVEWITPIIPNSRNLFGLYSMPFHEIQQPSRPSKEGEHSPDEDVACHGPLAVQ
jgi:hypothetical protein